MPMRPKFKRKNFVPREKVMPIRKLVRKIIKQESEHKIHSTSGAILNLSQSNFFATTLTNIGGGTDRNTRIGNDVELQRLSLRFTMTASSSGFSGLMRVYVIQNVSDDDPQLIPDVEGLMPSLYQSKVPYKVLFDKTYQFGLGINEIIIRNIRVKIPLNGSWFDSSGSSYTKGKVSIHFVANNPGPDQLEGGYTSKVYYTDN